MMFLIFSNHLGRGINVNDLFIGMIYGVSKEYCLSCNKEIAFM